MTSRLGPRIALATYSTKPRGGVVHTLALAEALHRLGANVTVLTLGDPAVGFYREVAAPTEIVPGPTRGETLEERIFASIDALEVGLRELANQFDIVHTQDCISARAAVRVQAAGAPFQVFRTVHHVDDFTTPALIHCQIQAILEPDRVFAVSRHWQELLREEYDVAADVVFNGVDLARFGSADATLVDKLRQSIGCGEDTFVFLAVGGLEPRKGSKTMISALAELKDRPLPRRVAVAVVGGHAFQDYQVYRDECHDLMAELDVQLDLDLHLVGTVSDTEMVGWYHAADALAFPSTKEGWGLVVLEALAARLPVITSDLPVFSEYLIDRETSLMVPVDSSKALADAMGELITSPELGEQLVAGGYPVAQRFSWDASAQRHLDFYTAP